MATMELDDPAQYGRVVRDKHGNVEKVVEVKAEGDATPEQLEIREVNTGIYAFNGGELTAGAGPDRQPTMPRASCTCRTCCRS